MTSHLLKFERILETYLTCSAQRTQQFPKSNAIMDKEKLWIKTTIQDKLGFLHWQDFLTEHHASHAASAFYASPY